MSSAVALQALHGLGVFVVFADVAHEFSFQVGHGSENAASDHIALDLGEPPLDLVELGRIGRGIMNMHPGVIGQEAFDPLGLVRGEAVADHVYLLAPRLVGDELLQEGDKPVTGMVRGGFTEHLTAAGVEGGIQGQGAVAVILKAVAFGASGRELQHGILAV